MCILGQVWCLIVSISFLLWMDGVREKEAAEQTDVYLDKYIDQPPKHVSSPVAESMKKALDHSYLLSIQQRL